ncbi:MAG: MCE family protein [Desulfosarcina sp.]|nr:MCE family protein [Desulfobacterales bacterium]
MSKKANTVAIGAFVIGAAILAVAGILTFGSGALFRDVERYVLYFEGDLKGLNVGAPVAWRGVRVGEVKRITVLVHSETHEFQIPVEVDIDHERFHDIGPAVARDPEESDLNDLIEKGMRAQLSLQSLVTAQLMIQLDMRPNTEAVLRGDGHLPEIPTIPSSIQRLANAFEKMNIGKMAENINRTMIGLSDIIEKREFEKFFGDFRAAAREIADLAREMRGRSALLTDEFQKTAIGARTLMRSLDNQVDPVATSAVQTMTEIQKAMARAEKSLATIDRLAADYSGDSAFRYELATALEEIAATARSVRALTDMLQQQPDALLRGKPGPGGN